MTEGNATAHAEAPPLLVPTPDSEGEMTARGATCRSSAVFPTRYMDLSIGST
jgi:hypothetical protein